jgi:hypothetical protein
MASYSGVNYAKTQASPITQIEEGQYNAPTLRILDQFVLTADLGSNDTILMGGPIPEGAVLLDCKIKSGALGGSAAINVGYQAGASQPAGSLAAQAVDLTAFFSALPVSSATSASAFGSTYEGDFYTQSPLTSQVQPVITCSVASSGGTGKTIFIDIAYTKNGG